MRWQRGTNGDDSTNSVSTDSLAMDDRQFPISSDPSWPSSLIFPQQQQQQQQQPVAARPLEQREQSAEEVMEASLSFRQQSLSTDSRWLLGSSGELYPRATSFLESDRIDNTMQDDRQAASRAESDSIDDSINAEGRNHSDSTVAAVIADHSMVSADCEAANQITDQWPGSLAASTTDELGPVVVASLDNSGNRNNQPDFSVAVTWVKEIGPSAAVASLQQADINSAVTAQEAFVAIDDEDELIAYKRACAGGYGHEIRPLSLSVSETLSPSPYSNQEAEVVDIVEHYIHPSESSHCNDARAELIGEDYSRSVNLPSPTVGALPNSCDIYENSGNQVSLSGWGSSFEEAIILTDSLDRKRPAITGHRQQINDCLEARIAPHDPELTMGEVVAAIETSNDLSVAEISPDLMERKLPAAACHQPRQDLGTRDSSTRRKGQSAGFLAGDTVVEVVEIASEAPAISMSNINGMNSLEQKPQATVEYHHQDNVPLDCSAAQNLHPNLGCIAQVVGISNAVHPCETIGESVAEIICSSSMERKHPPFADSYFGQNPPNVRNLEQVEELESADVVGIAEDALPSETIDEPVVQGYGSNAPERKSSDADRPNSWGSRASHQDVGFVVAEEEAEVIGITEDVHPSDIAGDSVAEFIGSSILAMAVQPETYGQAPDSVSALATGQATILGVSHFNNSVVEETGEGLNTGVVESECSPLVAVSMLQGIAIHQEERAVSEAQVLSDFITPNEDYPTKPHANPLDIAMAEQSSVCSPSLDQTSGILPSPSVPDNFVIASSSDYGESTISSYSREHALEENLEGTPIPLPTNFSSRDASATSTAENSRARSEGSGSQRSSLQVLSSNLARSTNTVIEKLFGDTPPIGRRRDFVVGDAGSDIHSRTLLPWSVFRNEATGMWVATLNTNQKALDSNNVADASKALKAFSVPTQKQAMALARSWAPPKMLAFQDNPSCFTCETRFAVFRRACHCRNCGVCICSRCSVQWPSKMIPETYNIKKESIINICKACDWLSTGFRLALLQGDFDRAVALHATGNTNLVTPFANVKGELFYPVHCAVLGGNLELLKWLVDENCCPLRSIRITGKHRDPTNSFTPILTSRGRSLLSISMEMKHVPMIRYLIVDKGMSIASERNITVDTIIQTLNIVLRQLPNNIHELESNETERPTISELGATISVLSNEDVAPADSPASRPSQQLNSPIPSSEVSAQHLEAIYGCAGLDDDEAMADDMIVSSLPAVIKFAACNAATTLRVAQFVPWTAPLCEYSKPEFPMILKITN